MTEAIHHLIEQYGLFAVFLGCVAEGESAAILGGFFAHQHVFVAWQAFLAAAIGAFAGDTFFFILGRSFADHPYVLRLKARPGFSHAFRLVSSHPNIFVLSNRYIYGMRKQEFLLERGTKPFELAVLFVRLFRSLDAIVGGDEGIARAWLKNANTAFDGAPIEKIQSISGLVDVIAYLDSRRALV